MTELRVRPNRVAQTRAVSPARASSRIARSSMSLNIRVLFRRHPAGNWVDHDVARQTAAFPAMPLHEPQPVAPRHASTEQQPVGRAHDCFPAAYGAR